MAEPSVTDDVPQSVRDAQEKPRPTVSLFDAVKAVFTDNKSFSTRCYQAIVRPLQGPTILSWTNPNTRCTASCTSTRSRARRCGGGRSNSSDPWWNAPSTISATPSEPTW